MAKTGKGRKRVLSAREWLGEMCHTAAWIPVALDLDSHEKRQRTMYNRILLLQTEKTI